MTFDEIKAMAADNGTASGILVKNIAEAMLERGDDDSRLNNIYDQAPQQGTQSGVLLKELLDVMYDLGYDEGTLDVLWENCEQQGTQSSVYVEEIADIAAEPAIEKPYPSTRPNVNIAWGNTGGQSSGVIIYNGGGIFTPDTEITTEWVRGLSKYVPFKRSGSLFTSQDTNVFVAKGTQLTVGHTLYVKYGPYTNGAEAAIIQDGPHPTRIAVVTKAIHGDAFTVWIPDGPYKITAGLGLYYRSNKDYATLNVLE